MIKFNDPDIYALIRKAVKESKAGRDSFPRMYEYMRGEMIEDVAQGLDERYHTRQNGPAHGRIAPVALPLFRAYVDEMATTYSGNKSRKLVAADGSLDEEATDIYRSSLDDMSYDHTMESAERSVVTGNGAGVYPQLTPDNEADLQIFYPHDIWTVPPSQDEFFSPSNQSTYAGYVLDNGVKEDETDRRLYTFVGHGGQVSYYGRSPDEENPKILSEDPHSLTWKGKPLNMLAILTGSKPVGQLLEYFEHTLYTDTREISIMWSALLDIMRHQGGATPVKTVLDPESVPGHQAIGVSFPVINLVGETFDYAIASNDYTGLVNMLVAFAKMMAVSMNLAPSDFSISEQKAQSGFAKIVENLPKTKSKARRAKWFSVLERKYMYPRLAALIAKKEKIPIERFEALTLEVNFEGDEVPLSIQEQKEKDDHEIELGLTSAAELLAEREDIPLADAEERIAENKAKRQPEPTQKPAFGNPFQQNRGGIAARIAGNRQRNQDDGQSN